MKKNPHKNNLAQEPSPLKDSPRPDLAGKTYANLLRCSNLTQADTSPEGQKRVNDAFGSICRMACVGDVYAEGVSGSQTFNREDIQELLELHRTTPFEVVVVHDLSRLTRGGIRHGHCVEDLFKKAGIQVVSSTDMIPNGPEGDLIKSVKHYANQLQARSISLAVARGLQQSLAKNSRPAAGRTPYALDRLYLGPDGKKKQMLIRWDELVQLWLNPETLEKVGERIKSPRPPSSKQHPSLQTPHKIRRKPFKGYTKQDDDISQLVAGAPDRMKVLIGIFEAYFLQHWGYHKIVNDLNHRKVPGPDGGEWTLTTVRSILFNPIYLGVEVRHRYSSALYNKITENGTVPVFVDQDQLEKEKRTSVPQQQTPMEDWKLVDMPNLKDILPSPLREIAAERIMKKFDPNVPPHPRKGKPIRSGEARHKHLDSPFVLSNLLHSKQTGHWMRGEVVNKKLLNGRKLYRYYFDSGAAVRGERGLNMRRVPAEPLEKAVLGVIEQVVSNTDDILVQVRKAAEELAVEPHADDHQRERLEAEQEDILGRLKRAYKLLGKKGCEALADELETDQKRLHELQGQLKNMDRTSRPKGVNVDGVIKNVVNQLKHMSQHLHDLPHAEIKQLLTAMVGDLVIDLATGELNFRIVMPERMTLPAQGALDEGNAEEAPATVRLDFQRPWPLTGETNGPGGRVLTLSHWRCQKTSMKCYACTRLKRAA